GFNVIGISTDDYAENAQEWLQRSNATLNHFLDRQLQMEHMLGAAHLPLTVLVDARGRVLDKIVGAQDWSSSEAAALLRRRFHLSRPPAGPSRTGWRSTPPAALRRTDLDQVSACRTPV
ncbi:MAG: hypothetical protein KGI67_04460, partial [Pseudomonadota bacterium]|nr:hypothetical protein [Pseudomonadota bacterium]